MLTYVRNTRIEWGDCDPAGIVFYPRYFAMFDSCTTAMFSQALGMSKFQFIKHYEFLGYPMVDTRARFLKPAKFGDDVDGRDHGHRIPPLQLRRAPPAEPQRRAGGGMLRHPGLGGARSERSREDQGASRSPQEVIAKFNAAVSVAALKPVTLITGASAGIGAALAQRVCGGRT